MNATQKLQAVIEAQCKGGYEKWKAIRIIAMNLEHGTVAMEQPPFRAIFAPHIFAILFNTDGLKAAYGEDAICEDCLNRVAKKCHCENYGGGFPNIENRDWVVAHRILDAWLSGDGNNAEAAIATAYELLP